MIGKKERIAFFSFVTLLTLLSCTIFSPKNYEEYDPSINNTTAVAVVGLIHQIADNKPENPEETLFLGVAMDIATDEMINNVGWKWPSGVYPVGNGGSGSRVQYVDSLTLAGRVENLPIIYGDDIECQLDIKTLEQLRADESPEVKQFVAMLNSAQIDWAEAAILGSEFAIEKCGK